MVSKTVRMCGKKAQVGCDQALSNHSVVLEHFLKICPALYPSNSKHLHYCISNRPTYTTSLYFLSICQVCWWSSEQKLIHKPRSQGQERYVYLPHIGYLPLPAMSGYKIKPTFLSSESLIFNERMSSHDKSPTSVLYAIQHT